MIRKQIEMHIKDNEYLVMKVMHKDGGMNYFSSKIEPKGVEVVFTKTEIFVDKTSTIERYTPMDNCNYRILVLEYKRKSQKKLDMVYQFVMDNKEELFHLWLNDLRKQLIDTLSKIGE